MSNLRSRTGESITGSTRTHKKAGETKLSEFFIDAGMTSSADADVDGWHVTETKKPPGSDLYKEVDE